MTLPGDISSAARGAQTGPRDELELELQSWRETVLTGVLWTALATGLVSILFLLHQGFTRYGILPFLVTMVAMLVITLTRRLRFGLRAGVLLGTVYAACALSLARFGPAPNAIVGLAFLVATSTLLLGRGSGIAATALGIATIAGTAALHPLGIVERDPGWGVVFDTGNPETVLRMVVVFGAGASVLVVGITHLLGRAESLLLDKMRSLRELRQAQADRERIRTELETREKALRSARELELLGRLAGFAAHDFNNALFVIQGNAELARQSLSDPHELEEAISAIESAAHKAAETSNQLLAFGTQPTQTPKRLVLHEQAERAARMLQRILPTSISVRVTTEPTLPVIVDEGMIQRAITSLALHARDRMREGGRLELTARGERPVEREHPTAPPRVVLEIADSEPATDPLTRGRSSSSVVGTPSAEHDDGLAFVRDLVTSNGGLFQVDRHPERGTCYRISFPAEPDPAPETGPSTPDALCGRVLVVEDDPHVRRVMVRVLERRGLTVSQCADGLTAQEEIKRQGAPISLLVTDCTLPGAPVSQLVETYRARNPRGRVLACSGYAPENLDLRPGLFDGFLPKPFDANALIESVSELLATHRT